MCYSRHHQQEWVAVGLKSQATGWTSNIRRVRLSPTPRLPSRRLAGSWARRASLSAGEGKTPVSRNNTVALQISETTKPHGLLSLAVEVTHDSSRMASGEWNALTIKQTIMATDTRQTFRFQHRLLIVGSSRPAPKLSSNLSQGNLP